MEKWGGGGIHIEKKSNLQFWIQNDEFLNISFTVQKVIKTKVKSPMSWLFLL